MSEHLFDRAVGVLVNQLSLWGELTGGAYRDYTTDIGTAQAKIMDGNRSSLYSALALLEVAKKITKNDLIAAQSGLFTNQVCDLISRALPENK